MAFDLTGHAPNAITLRELLVGLDAVADLIDAPAGDEVPISTVTFADSDDLSSESDPRSRMADLYVHVGVETDVALRWLDTITAVRADLRAKAVMSKETTQSAALRRAARSAGVALVAVHPKARWAHVIPLVQHMIDRQRRKPAGGPNPDLFTSDTDLVDLAQIIAHNTDGMVSIEDDQSRVLAYSPSDEAADELRTLSILGREGPRGYLRTLRDWGVFERLRESDEVIDIPDHPESGIRRRLVVGIRESRVDEPRPRILGSIWVQEGNKALAADAAEVLRGSAAVAARIISRQLDAPSTESVLIQRLFGAGGGGVDVPSVAGALGLSMRGPAAVIAFGPATGDVPAGGMAAQGSLLRLHASSFRRDSVTTVIDDRVYVLLPEYKSADGVAKWTRQLIAQLDTRRAIALRAAIAIPVTDLTHVAGARDEVDRVLDRTTHGHPEGRVTTLAESRTAVLLGEILELVGRQPELVDPRVDRLVEYDLAHGADLRDSAEVYLAAHGDVRNAAAVLRIHPNTLRYRVRRVEAIVGIDLNNPADRLLLELQLAIRRR